MGVIAGAQTLRVRRMEREADGVLSVVLARDDGADLPEFSCGAHLDVELRPGLIRQYSLCSDPADRQEWMIAVLREPTSRGGSEYVHDVLRPGMTVSVVGPRNNFRLVEAKRYLFIAGGIGITPLLPMIRHVAQEKKDWAMVYGGRRRASMAFVNELAVFESRVQIQPEEERGLLDLIGEIKPLPADTAVYCCGPEPLIAAVESICSDLGRTEPHIERFGARGGAREAKEGDNDTREFDIVLSSSRRRITIPAGRTITETLEAEGVQVATSCTEGFCGTCETEVVRGIPDHRDEYLSDEDRAANKSMMICVSRSKTPELELRI